MWNHTVLYEWQKCQTFRIQCQHSRPVSSCFSDSIHLKKEKQQFYISLNNREVHFNESVYVELFGALSVHVCFVSMVSDELLDGAVVSYCVHVAQCVCLHSGLCV